MRATAALLILSFFAPIVCAVESAWAASSENCGQMNQAPQPAPMAARCCLTAAIERPALREGTRPDTHLAPTLAMPATALPMGEPSGNERVAESPIPMGAPSPPHLYVLHAAFLI